MGLLGIVVAYVQISADGAGFFFDGAEVFPSIGWRNPV